nr:hypothetical protein GCM10020185_82480 [Pseudomonas brassicacearum subsp. brassicacearum]
MPAQAVPVVQPNGTPQNATLGVTSVQITGNTLSLDLANTFPFYPVEPNAPILTAEKNSRPATINWVYARVINSRR